MSEPTDEMVEAVIEQVSHDVGAMGYGAARDLVATVLAIARPEIEGPWRTAQAIDSEIIAEATRLLEYALHLRMHGERAPGGSETWARFDRECEHFLRTTGSSAVDQLFPAGEPYLPEVDRG